jgi:hypothetical protein
MRRARAQESKEFEAQKTFVSDGGLKLGPLTAGLGPVHAKVRFPSEKSALAGFGILLRSGGAETFGRNVYGLSSARQVRLLQEQKIPFEVVE